VVEEADGTMDLNEIAAAFRSDDQHFPVTKVVCLENSHNVGGGAPLPPTYVNAVGSLCRQNGIALHIDGARIFNAAVSSRCRFDGVK
jgi:threonine aldolase